MIKMGPSFIKLSEVGERRETQGGVKIEEAAEKNPDAIVKFPIDVMEGLSKAGAQEVAKKLGMPAAKIDEVADILLNLYKLFVTKDASMVEINPFAEVILYIPPIVDQYE